MSESQHGLSKIHRQILEVLQTHPKGIAEGAMREVLCIPANKMVQFGRRRRDLNAASWMINDALRVPRREAQANGCTVIHHVQRVAGQVQLHREVVDDFREVFKAVLESFGRRLVTGPERWGSGAIT